MARSASKAIGRSSPGCRSLGAQRRANVLQRSREAMVSNAAFPFMHCGRLISACALPGRSVSYTGDLGYEIWWRRNTSGAAFGH